MTVHNDENGVDKTDIDCDYGNDGNDNYNDNDINDK